MKRFHTSASIRASDGSWQVLLDGRPLRTPARALLAVPTAALAAAIAAEWDAQGETIDAQSMPHTRRANTVIDRVVAHAGAVAAEVARFGESDLLCYRASEPQTLVACQAECWDPLLAWAEARYDIALRPVTGIIHRPQSPHALERLREAVQAHDAWALGALHDLVTLSGSLVIGLAVSEGALSPQAGWDASLVDELYQSGKWGEDAEALKARAVRQEAFLAAHAFLDLLGSGAR